MQRIIFKNRLEFHVAKFLFFRYRKNYDKKFCYSASSFCVIDNVDYKVVNGFKVRIKLRERRDSNGKQCDCRMGSCGIGKFFLVDIF